MMFAITCIIQCVYGYHGNYFSIWMKFRNQFVSYHEMKSSTYSHPVVGFDSDNFSKGLNC